MWPNTASSRPILSNLHPLAKSTNIHLQCGVFIEKNLKNASSTVDFGIRDHSGPGQLVPYPNVPYDWRKLRTFRTNGPEKSSLISEFLISEVYCTINYDLCQLGRLLGRLWLVDMNCNCRVDPGILNSWRFHWSMSMRSPHIPIPAANIWLWLPGAAFTALSYCSFARPPRS